MTTYYIDYVSGSDSNNGTSTSTPWKHCPGDSNATGVADAYTPVSGDTFIFKGGVVYRGSITVSASGTSDNVITYDGNSSGTWGTGKAIIDGEREALLENARRYGFTSTNKSYFVINNFEIQNMRTVYHDSPNEYGDAMLFNGGHDIEVCNCDIHDIFPTPTPVVQGGTRGSATSSAVITATTFSDPTVDFTDYASTGGSLGYYKIVVGWNTDDYVKACGYVGPLVGGDPHTVTVYSDINRTTEGWFNTDPLGQLSYFYWLFDIRESHYAAYGSNAVRIEDAYNIRVHDNVIKECRNCVGIGWHSASSGFEIYNNDISACVWGLRLSGPRGQSGSGIDIHDNTIHDFTPYNTNGWGWHTDGIFVYGYAGDAFPAIAADGIDVYNNTFYGDFSIANTAMVYLENGCSNARVWNNVFRGITSNGYCVFGSSGINIWILNNTFYDSAYTKCIRMLNVTGIRLINCIWHGFNRWLGFFSVEDTNSELEQSSHNLFFLNGSSTDKRMEAEAVHYSVTEWLASEWGVGCLTRDPLFVSASDVRLQSSSPAIRSGLDVSTMIPKTDADGVLRTDNDWSIGAYEYTQTYYIDYDNGDDDNVGTSDIHPWKHCPGDPNATGISDTHSVIAGDTFIFKGGVVYRGRITLSAIGTSSDSISYIGNAWGTEKAIIDGADLWSPTWTQCTSSNDCLGNANYSNIWWATAPVGFEIFKSVFEDGEFVWFSQTPFPTDPIFYNRYQDFRSLSIQNTKNIVSSTNTSPITMTVLSHGYENGDTVTIANHTTNTAANGTWVISNIGTDTFDLVGSTGNGVGGATGTSQLILMTKTQIKDASFLTQSDSNYWVGNYVLVRCSPNVVSTRQITSFDTATHRITYSQISGDPYTDRDNYYAIVGNVGYISQAGVLGLYDGKIFLWPKNSDNPNNHIYSVSSQEKCIELYDCEYNTIDGLVIKGAYAQGSQLGNAIHSLTTERPKHIVIQNCDLKYCRSLSNSGVIYIAYPDDLTIYNNHIHDCQQNTGILCYGTNVKIDSNIVENVGYVGIWLMDATYSQITKNLIQNIKGTHANGVSVYQGSGSGSDNILVAHNKIFVGDENIPLTFSYSKNLYLIGNLIDGFNTSNCFDDWGSMSQNVYFLNNTIIRCASMNYLGTSDVSVYKFRNNIFETLGWLTTSNPPTDHQYNLYNEYSWQQNSQYWSLGTGEVYNTDNTAIFTNYSSADFTLKSTSPAVNAGTDVSEYYPTALFPDYDFDRDINGVPITSYDMGAYEYTQTYYIDYDNGDDSNLGTSDLHPWKHCPGDTNFTGTHTVIAGDTFRFKGGVVYRGSITVSASGTSDNVITYDGNSSGTWGTGKAIIDGSDIWSPTWTQCTSAEECGGNANYANIWWATVPVGFTTFTPLYEDGEFVWFAQSPFPSDPIFYNRYQYYKEIPLGSQNISATRTTIKDVSVFSQLDPSYWVGAYVILYAIPNYEYPSRILSYDPNTNTVTFTDIGSNLYTDRSSWYSVVGHAGIITGPQQFGVYDGKIFIWTKNSDNPNNHTYSISKRYSGIDLKNSEYIVLDNLLIQGQFCDLGDTQRGCAVRVLVGELPQHITIQNCEITKIRSMGRAGAIAIGGGNDIVISRNHIHHCQKNNGAVCKGSGIYFDNNIVEYVGYKGVWFTGGVNSRITRNIIRYTNGTHGDGLSVFAPSVNVLVAFNEVRVGGQNIPFTIESAENLYIIGNVFDGMEESNVFYDWGGMTGVNYILNNTIVRAVLTGLHLGADKPGFYVYNNIIDAGLVENRAYNLYTGLTADQTPNDGWYPAVGEIVNENVSSIFTEPSVGDFTLKSTSPAINAGTDVSSYYPTALFPDFDFTKDITGKTRINWDIGAYFYGDTPITRKKCYGFMINGRYFFLQT